MATIEQFKTIARDIVRANPDIGWDGVYDKTLAYAEANYPGHFNASFDSYDDACNVVEDAVDEVMKEMRDAR